MFPLVSPALLAEAMREARVVIVDCRHELATPEAGAVAYRDGHIPGAAFMHVDHDLAGPRLDRRRRFRGRHPLPSRTTFSRKLAALGVRPGMMLVAYDAADSMYAARLWWLARWAGHGDVAVLDGGLAAWCAGGHSTSATGGRYSGPAAASPAPWAMSRSTRSRSAMPQAPLARVAANVQTRRWTLIDARASERYAGAVEPIDPHAGHIPGAINRPFRDNLGEHSRFKPPARLRAEFDHLLAGTPPSRVIHQCGSGISACHNILAMEIAGLSGSALYPGSWSEWCADDRRPRTRGPLP